MKGSLGTKAHDTVPVILLIQLARRYMLYCRTKYTMPRIQPYRGMALMRFFKYCKFSHPFPIFSYVYDTETAGKYNSFGF